MSDVLIREVSTPFSADELALADYDDRGVFAAGRHTELALLQRMGYRSPVLGRLYEGHFNAVLLVALFGTALQRRSALHDARNGRLFGVWNTQANEPVRLARSAGNVVLSGAKTWCSGAGTVTRALITASADGGAPQMLLVPMDRVTTTIDASAWQPLGMEDSESFRVVFDGVVLSEADVIGSAGDYERSPWLFGGALRFAAVHAGIVARLADETCAFLAAAGRQDDPYQIARAGELAIAAQDAKNWIDAGEAAWLAFDREPGDANAAKVVTMADMARLAIERLGLATIETAVRAVGARGLLEPLPFAKLVRDFTMYLRQPAPDATLARVGAAALRSRERLA